MIKNGKKIRLFSRLLRATCGFAVIVSITYTICFWFLGETRIEDVKGHSLYIEFFVKQTDHLTLPLKMSGLFLDLFQSLFFFIILFILAKMFKLYEQFYFFTKKNATYIRQIGYVLLASQIAYPFYVLSRSYILTSPDYQFVITASSLFEIKTLFLTLIIFLASDIVRGGAYLEDEYRGTI